MGAMLMKIVILLGENESHITKNSKIVRKILIILKIFMNFLMGAMLIKIVILLKENESHITKNFKHCEKMFIKMTSQMCC